MGLKGFIHFLVTKRVDISFSDLKNEKVHVRLVVAIPIILMVLVMGYGIIYLGVFNALINSAAPSATDVEYLFDALATFKMQLIGSVIVSFIVGIFLAYAITLPLQKLTLGAKTVSAGDLTKTLNIDQEDEIGALVHAFNDMIISLNRYFLNSISGAALTLDGNKNIIGFNEAAELVTGRIASSVIGHHVATIFPKNLNEEFYNLLDEAVQAKHPKFQSELTLSLDDRTRIPISLSTSLLRKEDDSILGVIVNFQDLDKIKNDIRQSQIMSKLTSLGTLAAGLAHEIKNPLGSIKGLSQLIKEDLQPDDPKIKYVDTIIKEMEKLNNAVETILDFSQQKPTEGKIKEVGVNQLLDEMIELLLHGFKREDINLIKEYTEESTMVMVDNYRVQQAFLNIAINAFNAMGSGGQLKIMTERIEYPDGKEWIRVDFTDSGDGIPEHIVDKIFDPFFSTKRNGTGLGLSIAHQAVVSHGGRIEVHSEEGRGTTFSIFLPAGSVESSQS